MLCLMFIGAIADAVGGIVTGGLGLAAQKRANEAQQAALDAQLESQLAAIQGAKELEEIEQQNFQETLEALRPIMFIVGALLVVGIILYILLRK